MYVLNPEAALSFKPIKALPEQAPGINGRSRAEPLLTTNQKLYYPGREHALELTLDHDGNILSKKILHRALFATLEDHTGKLWFAERHDVRVLENGRAGFINTKVIT